MGFLLGPGSLGCSRLLALARSRVNGGLLGTREASRAGGTRVEVVGSCRLAVASANAREVSEGSCRLAVAGANAREVFEAGAMSIFSFVERKVDLVPIGGGQGG